MAGRSKSRFIILLNKSPKGPLGVDEINTLLDKKIIRRNDLAYRLPEGEETKAPTEWKLLWQFEEFDRRREDKSPEERAHAHAHREEERRKKESPAVIKSKTLSDVPPELLDIEPEELIPRSSRMSSIDRSDDVTEQVDLRALQDDEEPPDSPKWIFAGVAAFMILVGSWMFYTSGRESGAVVEAPQAQTPMQQPAARPMDRRPAAAMARPSAAPPPISSPQGPSRRNASESPRYEPDNSEPDSGEIAEDDSGEGEDGEVADGRPFDPRRRVSQDPNDPRAREARARQRNRPAMRPVPGDEAGGEDPMAGGEDGADPIAPETEAALTEDDQP